MPVQIVQGQTTYIDPQVQYADSGWSVSGGFATHLPCFAGTIVSTAAYPFIDGTSYDISYFVDNYSVGNINSVLGASTGVSHSSSGTFTDIYTYHTGDVLKFYSDGGLRVSQIQVSPHLTSAVQNAVTVVFHEPSNKWVQGYDWIPEAMTRFGDSFFSFLNGQLWEHETNPIAGSFYGTKYPVNIIFIVNNDYELEKIWYNLRLDAKGAWYAPTLNTPTGNQFPYGMQSRLKVNNLKLIDNKLWADILGDQNDPNFATITDPTQRALKALFEGRKMQGGWLIVQLQCNDNAVSEISSAEFYYAETHRSI